MSSKHHTAQRGKRWVERDTQRTLNKHDQPRLPRKAGQWPGGLMEEEIMEVMPVGVQSANGERKEYFFALALGLIPGL